MSGGGTPPADSGVSARCSKRGFRSVHFRALFRILEKGTHFIRYSMVPALFWGPDPDPKSGQIWALFRVPNYCGNGIPYRVDPDWKLENTSFGALFIVEMAVFGPPPGPRTRSGTPNLSKSGTFRTPIRTRTSDPFFDPFSIPKSDTFSIEIWHFSDPEIWPFLDHIQTAWQILKSQKTALSGIRKDVHTRQETHKLLCADGFSLLSLFSLL